MLNASELLALIPHQSLFQLQLPSHCRPEAGSSHCEQQFNWLLVGIHLIQALQDYDHEVMNNLKLVDAGPDGSVEFDLYMSERYSNLNGTERGASHP